MNILDHLESDHRGFRRRLDEIEGAELGSAAPYFGRHDADIQASALASLRGLTEELERHERLEHLRLFPALLRQGALGRELVHGLQREHDRLDHDLGHLKAALANSPGRPGRRLVETLLRLLPRFRRHMLSEEQELFPLARRVLGPEVLESLDSRPEAASAQGGR